VVGVANGLGNVVFLTVVQKQVSPALLGPALGGTLVAVTRSSTAAFAVDAASFAISALTLLLIPRRPAAGPVTPTEADVMGAGEGAETGEGVLALLRRSRALQVIMVVIAANLASGGMGEVALPSLAHAKFVPEAACICLVPYLGGEPGAAAALFVVGVANGLGNVVFLTVVQKQVSPALLGRVMGAIMLGAFGSFPLSVAITGLLVHRLGPALFFPIAGGLVAAAILGGLTQREFRNFGAAGADRDPDVAEAEAGAGVLGAAAQS